MDSLTPTITQVGWTTAPTNLTNIYDKDLSTVTGEAVDTAAPTTETDGDCQIKIDLGAQYIINKIYVKLGIRAGGAAEKVFCQARAGDVGDLTDALLHTGNIIDTVGETEELHHIYKTVADVNGAQATNPANRVRYITLRCRVLVATEVAKLKVYEVIALGYKGVTF